MQAIRLCALLTSLLLAAPASAQTAVSPTGIHFPDGTLQSTAAASPVAYPQQCVALVQDGQFEFPSCSGLGGGPSWDPTTGVPSGHYFLVTDVLLAPSPFDETAEATIDVYQHGACDAAGDPIGFARWSRFRFIGATDTRSFRFESPLFVLPPGHCLRFVSHADHTTTDVRVQVNGYLTPDPSTFHP